MPACLFARHMIGILYLQRWHSDGHLTLVSGVPPIGTDSTSSIAERYSIHFFTTGYSSNTQTVNTKVVYQGQ